MPTCAQLPTVAHVSTIVPAPTCAPMLTKLGISTTSLPMYVPRRTIAPGTTRAPSLRNCDSSKSGEARRNLVPERRRIGFDEFHVLRAEIQQHGFLQPFVDRPAALAVGLGDAEFAGLQAVDHALDGRPRRALDLLGRQHRAPFPGAVDHEAQFVDARRRGFAGWPAGGLLRGLASGSLSVALPRGRRAMHRATPVVVVGHRARGRARR